jgi:adenine-specific DNA methylase
MLEFIADFANWDLAGDDDYLKISRDLVATAHAALTGLVESRPTVVDPFAGGGAIPLEALRVGADAYASDLNPVPILLNKTVLEFVPKYGQRLADTVRDLGAEIGREVSADIERFYPRAQDGTPLVYLWSRTVLSEAPDVGDAPVEIPLLRSMWISKKKGRKFALRWRRDAKGNIETTASDVEYADGTRIRVRRPLLEVFTPRSDKEVEAGTSKAGAATCPLTGFTTPVESVRTQLARRRGGASDARMVAVVVSRDGGTRFYRTPHSSDEAGYASARAEFLQRANAAMEAGQSLLPDGHINHLRGFFNIVLYGMTKWGDLFSPRQGLALTCFAKALERRVEALVREEEHQFALATHTCLALAVDRLAEKLSSVARWDTSRENPQGTFGRQALPMVWDFCEVNPFSGSGGDWGTALDWVVRVLDTTAAAMLRAPGTGHVQQASATKHPLPDDSVAAIFTDPPYYAAVPYADLSDYFYSWLRRTLGRQYPELFTEPLSPKDDELVSLSHRAAMYRNKDGAWFEEMMERACSEARRICQPSGVGVFVFASKDTPAWEAMLSALVQSGWVVTASWPIDTEMGSRLRARNSATLASSIHIVCRPRETDDGEVNMTSVADWRDVLDELPERIHAWLPRLAQEGVVGADAIFACLGPALEVFTRFARVEKISGEVVTLREFLEQVWAAVSREALSMLFSSADASGLEEDARLTAMWLWTLAGPSVAQVVADDGAESTDDDDDEPSVAKGTGYVLEYDAARKIAQGLGARLDELTHVVEVKGDQGRLLAVVERTKHLFGKAEGGTTTAKKAAKKKQMTLFGELDQAAETQGWGEVGSPKAGTTTLDRVHQAMLLFGAGRGEALKRFIVEEGVGKQPQFWKLAQSLSALYPTGTDEKRWVDGVLARKKGLGF